MKKIFFVLLLILIITLIGCTTPLNQITENKPALCSNAEYSTQDSPTKYLGGTENLIFFDSESANKYYDTYSQKGNAILTEIETLTCLEYLQVLGDEISDISPLSNLTNLKMLSISSSKVTDLSPLENLQKLGQLSLINTKVTNTAPLTKLTSLKKLRIIGCSNCYKATPILFDCEKLKSDLPNVNVTCEDSLD